MILKKLLATASGVIAAMMIFTNVAMAAAGYTVTENSVNVRKTPSTDALVLGRVNANDIVQVLDSANGWKKIQYGDSYAWIYGQFLRSRDGSQSSSNTSQSSTGTNQNSQVQSQGTVYTNAGEVNLREGAGTGYGRIACLEKGVNLTLLGTSDGWSRVQTKSGKIGWILSKFLSSGKAPSITSRGSDNGGVRNSDLRSKIVSYAKKFLGVNYVYGGSTPSGFDCSGYTQYVLRQYGIYIERVAADQARVNGYRIDKSDLRPGDLVFFDTDGGRNYINHVGIYIGNGNMIHASSGQGQIVISDISGGFYAKSYMTARRVIQ
jgi:N-acetylmuramoyl-L-alanine amidase